MVWQRTTVSDNIVKLEKLACHHESDISPLGVLEYNSYFEMH